MMDNMQFFTMLAFFAGGFAWLYKEIKTTDRKIDTLHGDMVSIKERLAVVETNVGHLDRSMGVMGNRVGNMETMFNRLLPAPKMKFEENPATA